MKLTYRGINYDSHPHSLEVSEGEVGGKYRGQEWRVHRVKGSAPRKSSGKFTYRGVTYTH